MSRLSVGPFSLVEVIGEGGMGTVWRAVHTASGQAVALKVLTAGRSRHPEYRKAFRSEVRAQAGLSHSTIAAVYDHGDITGPEAQASQGVLVQGSPYLAMELVEGGDLTEWAGRLSWSLLRDTLLVLLDALAHAHGRGVIHRDLKLPNVLVQGSPPSVVLTDFGIAHAADDSALDPDTSVQGAGTPSCMAPEQIDGRFRDQGPHTDLYALGVLAWTLATGVSPFARDTAFETLMANLTQPPPAFVPRCEVPSGFPLWLARLLDKEPGRRFQRAADASWALRHLPGSRESQCLRVLPPLGSWRRRDEEERQDIRLQGAGLGLWGLRPVPMVGREAERQALWASLQRARQRSGAEIVVLRGGAGTGKSRLARWLAQRAHEEGAASIFRAVHPGVGSPGQGLVGLVARALGCLGATRGEVQEHTVLREDPLTLTAWEWEELFRLLTGGELRIQSAAELFSLVHRLVMALSGGLDQGTRPALVWLDDVHHAAEAIRLAQHIHPRDMGKPVLVVLTAREDLVAARPVERDLLAQLCASPGVQTLELGPLPAVEHRELVQGLVGLERSLVAQVAHRTQGNPLFAIQLVGDWVTRGVLEPGPQGFRLVAGERAEIPDDLHSLWVRRVDRLVWEHGRDAREALEVAALLGGAVVGGEWRQACKGAGVEPPAAVLESLLERGLVERVERGWSFTHTMLRESLERSAREGGRWRRMHGACATMLQLRYGGVGRGIQARLGRHLLEAGRATDSLQPLLQGAEEALRTSDYDAALELLDLRERAQAVARLAESDPRRGRPQVLRTQALVAAGRLQEAGAAGQRAVASAREHGWDCLAEALLFTGLAAGKQGKLQVWTDLALEGLHVARSAGQPELEARCLLGLANAARSRGKVLEAVRWADAGCAALEAMGDERHLASALATRSSNHRQLGQLDQALDQARRASARFSALGSRYGVGSCQINIGEVLRYQGDLAGALEAYHKAWELLRQVGSPAYRVAGINLGLVLVARGEHQRAATLYSELLRELQSSGQRAYEGIVHALILPCLAAGGDRQGLHHHRVQAERILTDTGVTDRDIAEALEDAAVRCRRRRWMVEHEALAEMAQQQRGALG